MKITLLCICILFVATATLGLSNIATSAGLPTNAPAEEMIVTPYGGYSTPPPISTDLPYSTSEPYPTYSYPPPVEPYPAPDQAMTENEFAQLIISIFGINHNGKNVQHK